MSADQSFASAGGRRRHTRRIPLTIAIAGNSGTGKTALVDALAGHRVGDRSRRTRETTAYSAGKANELRITQHPLEDDDTEFNTTVLDVHNFGYFTDCMLDIDRLTQYLEDRFDEMVSEQSRIRRNPRFVDRRVHACIYLLDSAHGLNETDVTAMTRLSTLTTIIPVIGRAESLTADELKSMKRKVREDCKHYKIPIFEFDKDLGVELPMHIIRTNEYDENGNALLSLKLSYGRVDATDPDISDFNALRSAVLNNYAFDLIDHTVDVLYEQYRTIRLSDPNARYSVLEPDVLAGHATRLKQEMLERESRELKEQEERVQRELEQRRNEIIERERELRLIAERLEAEKATAAKARQAEEAKSAVEAKAAKDAAERQQRAEDLARQNSIQEAERRGTPHRTYHEHQPFNENDEHDHDNRSVKARDTPILQPSAIKSDPTEPPQPASTSSSAVTPPPSVPPPVPNSGNQSGTSLSSSGIDPGVGALPAGTHQSYVSLNSSDYGDGSFVSVRPIKVAGTPITGTGAKVPPPPVPPVPASIAAGTAKTGPIIEPTSTRNNWGSVHSNNGSHYTGSKTSATNTSTAKTSPAPAPSSSGSAKTGPVITTPRQNSFSQPAAKSAAVNSSPLQPPATPKVGGAGSSPNSPKSIGGVSNSPKSTTSIGKTRLSSLSAAASAAATAAAASVSSRLKSKQGSSVPSSPQVNYTQSPKLPQGQSPKVSQIQSPKVPQVQSPKVPQVQSPSIPQTKTPKIPQNGTSTPKMSPPEAKKTSSSNSSSPERPAIAPQRSFVASPQIRGQSSFASLRETPPGSPPVGRAPRRPDSGEVRPNLDTRTPSYISADSNTAPLSIDNMPGAFPRKSSQNRELSQVNSTSSLSVVSAEGPNTNSFYERHQNQSGSSLGSDNPSSPSLPPRSPNRPASFVSLGSTLSRTRSTTDRNSGVPSGTKLPYIPSVPKIPASPK